MTLLVNLVDWVINKWVNSWKNGQMVGLTTCTRRYILPVPINGNNVYFTSSWHSSWPLPFKSHDTTLSLDWSFNVPQSLSIPQTSTLGGSKEDISISLLHEEEMSEIIMSLVRFNWYSRDERVLGKYSVQRRSLQGDIMYEQSDYLFLFYLSMHELSIHL